MRMGTTQIILLKLKIKINDVMKRTVRSTEKRRETMEKRKDRWCTLTIRTTKIVVWRRSRSHRVPGAMERRKTGAYIGSGTQWFALVVRRGTQAVAHNRCTQWKEASESSFAQDQHSESELNL